jgi:hypothetical protein
VFGWQQGHPNLFYFKAGNGRDKIPSNNMKRQKLLANIFAVWRRLTSITPILIVVYLLTGALIVTHYGESWDEPLRYDYAVRSLQSYSRGIPLQADEKGPFFGMVALLGSMGIQAVVSGLKSIDAWHFMTYLSFVMGICFFYRLCRRLVDPGPALAATLLFSTQPVIWGHAFINPKDIPFMAFFLASVTLGLEMVDRFCPAERRAASVLSNRAHLAQDWQGAPARLRRLLVELGSTWLGLILIYPLLQAGVAWLATQVYAVSSTSPVKQVLSLVEKNEAVKNLQTYIHKAQELDTWLVLIIWIGLSLAFMLVLRRIFATMPLQNLTSASKGWFKNLEANLIGELAKWRSDLPANWSSVTGALRSGRFLHSIVQPRVLVAACFLGFCSDIRTLGPAAGLLVAFYFLYKARSRAIPVLLVYFSVGALVAYFFWPYLWNAPVSHYLASLGQAENFGGVTPQIFNGVMVSGDNPPSDYLTTFFSLQFTETALAQMLVGAILASILFWKKGDLRMDILLLGAWFGAPVVAAIVLQSAIYNNFRQFLFVTPPLFVLTGLAFQELWSFFKSIKRETIFSLAAFFFLLPGLYADIQLHPYEYIYYNGLIGGVGGAFRLFDTDYWDTSYKEDFEFLDSTAPQNSIVLVTGQYMIAPTYARSDLRIISSPLVPGDQSGDYYVLIQSSDREDQTLFPDSKVVYQVTRDGAILSVVKQISPGDAVGK